MQKITFQKATLALIVATVFQFVAIENPLAAQAGYSNAAVGMGRGNQVKKADEIIVEEYFNYRRHALPLPKGNETVNLDLSWGSKRTTENGDAVLQIGITTARFKADEMPPVNLCIVLDRSGSMSGDRIMNTRNATKELVRRLRPQDRISVVLFDNIAEILVPSQMVKDQAAIIKLLDGVVERGGTNLNAGFQLGYKEVAAHYNEFPANKIVFLTDALANLGVTDPYEILRQTGVYQKQMNIDLTLIGVGENFDATRARALTSKGHSVHFIQDSREIQKIFIDELESLLAPIGREVSLEIEWEQELDLVQQYGYNVAPAKNKLVLPINNMNGGLTQIALLDLKLTNNNSAKVTARLVWKDAITQQPRQIAAETKIKKGKAATTTEDNADLRLNYQIAQAAQSLKDAATLYYAQNAKAAIIILKSNLNELKKLPANTDLDLVIEALEGMKNNIEAHTP